MRRVISFITLLVLIGSAGKTSAQELNCNVTVLTPQIQGTQKRVYESLEVAIEEFMNNRKWTDDTFSSEERIQVNIQITVSDQISLSEFQGSIQVQSSRPVYYSDYNTPLFFANDNDFHVKYLENTTIRFSRGMYTDNLSSVLAYYAYMVLGMDYDSFSEEGGTDYYEEAQAIVSTAQNSGEQGWKASEGQQNRYWLVENILSRTFEPLRECLYKYHRLGFDRMYNKTDEAREVILESLVSLKQIHQIKPSSFNLQMFFFSKSDELIKLFKVAPGEQRQEVYRTLKLIDPGNIQKYEQLAG